MVAEFRVYFEGDSSLKEGFRTFFNVLHDAAKHRGCRIRLIDCGPTAAAIQDFKDALRKPGNAWMVLLIDSDAPDDGKLFARRCEGLEKPLEDSVFWMVQMMESWFLADPEALKRFYGQGFQESALRGDPQVEQIPKADIYSRLERATKETAKGKYHKTRHAPQLLRFIDSQRVRQSAPNCERMFKTVLTRLSA